MLPEKYRWIEAEFEPEGDPVLLLAVARELLAGGNREGAATVLDRAYGLDPSSAVIRDERARLLNDLAVVEHGILFRYVPGGVFLMGSWYGERDERPVHPVWLSPYWMAETPVSWSTYCRLMGYEMPPAGAPPASEQAVGTAAEERLFALYGQNRIRLQFCEDQTTHAVDWHSHSPALVQQGTGTQPSPFHPAPRADPGAPWVYETKPMVAVGWENAEEMAARLSGAGVRYGLPTEAQWEKAARGGLIGARYANGDRRPSPDECDCQHFNELSIRPMKAFAPNGYGLYAVNGGVWEWCRDWYDSEWYAESPRTDPEGPRKGKEKVLRGGSWADCAEVATVSFRMSCKVLASRNRSWVGSMTPNFGSRLCRTEVPRDDSPAG
jgi:formylglycine-generating enzyme required for sulfatase activity